VHEAGLAIALVAAIRDHDLAARRVRVLVTGGHDDPFAFDDALRFHMALAGPELVMERIDIVHLPSKRWCPSCGHRFEAAGDAECPLCGRATMSERTEEQVELEVLDGDAGTMTIDEGADGHHHDGPGPGSSDPPEHDRRPSAPPGPDRQA
jgi:Zn finger protein HypA/HybF involved in hydrogenase expression